MFGGKDKRRAARTRRFIFNQIMEEESEKEKYNWRMICEDGSEYGIDPEDYETEEEYNEALEEEKYSWRDSCEDGSEYDIDPEEYETEEEYNEVLEEYREALDGAKKIKETDYPNKRQYNAACALAELDEDYINNEYTQRIKACCTFILEKSDTIIAANYLTHDGYFLYSRAIKDTFQLPVTLPDEDEVREYDFEDILKKIERKSSSLCLEVWSWCLDQFLNYSEYDKCSKKTLTYDILNDLCDFSEEFVLELIRYMSEHPEFRKKVVREGEDIPRSLSKIIVEAIKFNYPDTAKGLFEDGLFIAKGRWKPIIKLMCDVIRFSMNYTELETAEYVEQNFLPLVKTYEDGMIVDEIEIWEQQIAKYKAEVERDCEQYAYTRSNAWRQSVPEGEKYGLDPCWYESKEAYLAALDKVKNRWRSWYKNKETFGLNPKDYETEAEFVKDLSLLRNEKINEWKGKLHRNTEEQEIVQTITEDSDIYIYCGVILPFSSKPYSFRTNDESIKIGDTVIVPVGKEQKETEGKVVSVGQYMRVGVPYPVEKTSFILRKI